MQDTATRLHSAAIHLLRRLRKADQVSGLSGPALSALSVIVHGGPLSLRDLAGAEQVRPATMSRIVQNLLDDGLITRESSLKDKRAVVIRATDAGLTMLEDGRKRRVDALESSLGQLSTADRAALDAALPILERVSREGSSSA